MGWSHHADAGGRDFVHPADRAATLAELRNLAEDGSQTAQARTLEHGLLNLGVEYKSATFDANLKMGLDVGLKTNTAIVNFQEIFYTVAFTPPATATPFFDSSVRLSEVKHYAEISNAYGEPNPPAYISQVDYGRSLTVIITGSES
jgi:hypothetical protein